MNLAHRLCCRSNLWKFMSARAIVPYALRDIPAGGSTLEIGPGYGANVAALQERCDRLTGLEIDAGLARGLRARQSSMTVVSGDGTAMPFADNSFDSIVCFTMLHHVPTPALQDAVFAEAARTLRPGGWLAGSDGTDNPAFRLVHQYDTYVPIEPGGLADRLHVAGLVDVAITAGRGQVWFRGRAE
ncbi:class I SAM-dependent methyltransferase [Gordonia sp. CPCC 205333]|uniref:class I SAM-dependent methyltransferase n=1 Tax=Gordonia sp. CPCC 205333 TaxID=3140790 RepID=UPI003AF35577